MHDNLYAVTRKYLVKLLFHHKSYWDSIESNRWELYGTAIKPEDKVLKSDFVNVAGWTARCDLHKGRFEGLKDERATNDCLTVISNGGYIRNRTNLAINNTDFTISCWFRINSKYMDKFANSDNRNITLCGWKDAAGNEISIDVYCRDIENTDTLDIICLKVYYNDNVVNAYYTGQGPTIFSSHWNFFSFQRYGETDLIHINGMKLLTVSSKDEYKMGNEIEDLKFGSFKSYSSGGIDIDEICVMNDHISAGNYDVFRDYIFNVLVEDEYHEENRQSMISIFHEPASHYGLSFNQYESSGISGDDVSFSVNNTSEKVLSVFMNSTYVDPIRYTGTSNNITIKDSADKEIMSSSLFTMISLNQNEADDFYVEVKQITGTGTNELTIPDSYNTVLGDDGYLLFDGVLGFLQKNRYTYNNGKITLNNPSDKFVNSEGKITFVYIKMNPAGSYADIEDLTIGFVKIQGLVYPHGEVVFPSIEQNISYTLANMLFFVNGTYLPPSSFSIEEQTKLVFNSTIDDENVKEGDNVTAVCMVAYTSAEDNEDMLDYINGVDEWNEILNNVEITRNTKFKFEDDEGTRIASFHKTQWYENNQIPSYNFYSLDKNKKKK